ncbi:MAG: response regulator transcription factor [Opitutaceae bacterium]|nr:response regulator transcription factor [Opitutaceae bacterium]
MKFAIVEDQIMFRALLRRLLVEDCKGEVVLEAGSLAEVRKLLDGLTMVDLLLLDIRLPDGDGIEFVEELNKSNVAIPVLLLSSSCDDYIVHRVNRSFAQGFVHKDDEPQMLLTAIQVVAAGGSFYSPRYEIKRREMAKAPDSFAKLLSPREQELLRHLGTGYADAELASALGLSVDTVKTHRRNVMTKLNLHTAQELQAYALKTGFTTVDHL